MISKICKFLAFSLEFKKFLLTTRTFFSHSRSEQFWFKEQFLHSFLPKDYNYLNYLLTDILRSSKFLALLCPFGAPIYSKHMYKLTLKRIKKNRQVHFPKYVSSLFKTVFCIIFPCFHYFSAVLIVSVYVIIRGKIEKKKLARRLQINNRKKKCLNFLTSFAFKGNSV